MIIIIAGATGFVGAGLARKLISDGHDVSFLVRPGSRSKIPSTVRSNMIYADPAGPLEKIEVRADVLINAIGIIREFPGKGITFQKVHYGIVENLVDFAKTNGINRFVQISALGAGPECRTEYHKSKFAAEELIRGSGLRWTILRPSMIIGPGDHVTGLFAGMVKRLPIVPVIGDGNYRLQPLHIDDLAGGVSALLDKQQAFDKVFEIGGPDILTYNGLIDEIGRVLGKSKVRKIHLPILITRVMAGIFGRFGWFPITNEQLSMLLDGNFTRETAFFELCGVKPRNFRESLTGLL